MATWISSESVFAGSTVGCSEAPRTFVRHLSYADRDINWEALACASSESDDSSPLEIEQEMSEDRIEHARARLRREFDAFSFERITEGVAEGVAEGDPRTLRVLAAPKASLHAGAKQYVGWPRSHDLGPISLLFIAFLHMLASAPSTIALLCCCCASLSTPLLLPLASCEMLC